MLWVTWQTQGWTLTLSWLAWTWLIALLHPALLPEKDRAMIRSRILGTGFTVPEQVVTND